MFYTAFEAYFNELSFDMSNMYLWRHSWWVYPALPRFTQSQINCCPYIANSSLQNVFWLCTQSYPERIRKERNIKFGWKKITHWLFYHHVYLSHSTPLCANMPPNRFKNHSLRPTCISNHSMLFTFQTEENFTNIAFSKCALRVSGYVSCLFMINGRWFTDKSK